MSSRSAPLVARNSDPVYNASLPSRVGVLPPTERRMVAGLETSRDESLRDFGLFGREPRHYNLIARMVSMPAVVLSPYNRVELEGSVRLSCGDESVDLHEEIPSIKKGCSFLVSRPADLFAGGTIVELTPGRYTTGDTVVDRATGRVYLELSQNGQTAVGVIGVFMRGRTPRCVDWRVIESS